MATTQEILDQLNAYDASRDYSSVDAQTANNVWGDVILGLEDYDREATEALPGVLANDRFVLRGGDVVAYDHGAKRWIEQS